MKSINDFLEEMFVGKILKSSEFNDFDETWYDAMGNVLNTADSDFNPIGKKIIKACLGFSEAREDIGVHLTFEGYSEPFFFYENDELEVE